MSEEGEQFRDVTLQNQDANIPGAGLDPRVILTDQKEPDYEELYPAIPYELQTVDIVLLAVRCGIIAFFLLCLIIVIVDIARDKVSISTFFEQLLRK